MRLSGVGVWNAGLSARDPGAASDAVAELEELGYTSLWMPGAAAGILDRVELLLTATSRLVVATGVLSIWIADPAAVALAHARLQAAHGRRFLLGLGVSHAALVEALPGNPTWDRPLARMSAFLDALDAQPEPVTADDRVLAALGPRMLQLAAARSAGAHPYNVPPEHTVAARGALGPAPLLVPEVAVCPTTDAAEARRLARAFFAHYFVSPNYAGNLLRLGFAEDDLADGGSDRVIDALVAWGDDDTIRARVREHFDAGADSVCIQVIGAGDHGGMIDLRREEWRRLAPVLTTL
jgi:probable F420-dependent oxidoreductase